ncbi:MAG: SusC/RagA family TonB-linked outer membrane protein, partial [Bacteroidetes bacterium]|nr:SusC/RagA family TonB-linked outer membrane protein [Bacteroidota bacterium]
MRKFLLALISFGFVLSAWAQDRIVSGKVSSTEDGSSLPGVNVVLKGTANGAVTDVDGNYKLSVPGSGGTLVFSFIGLVTQEVEIGTRTVVDVQMASDVKQLSEVVVTAQGIRSEKKALGYAVTTVGGSALQQRPEQDVARMMSGQVPGVQINQTNGMSGTGTSIIIRGFTTISGTNQPLFVIDGVPFNTNTNQQGSFGDGSLATSSRFLDLDPNNIESISVLKGLSATVLYGEQGKKGVVLITTKNGSTKKKDFEVSLTQSVFANKIASLPEYQNNYGNGFNSQFGFFFSNWGPHFNDGSPLSKINTPAEIPHPYSHWGDPSLTAQFPQYQGQKIPYVAQPDIRGFFRTGVISNTSINIGGSSEKVNYNANFGYSKEEGFVPGNDLTKINGGVGITGQLTKKFSINTTLNFARTQMQTPPISSAGAGGGISGNGFSLFSELLFTPRSVDLLHLPFETPADHRSVYYRTGNDIQNPLWTAKYSRQTDNVNRFYGKTAFTYDINDHLNLVYRLGLDTYSEQQEYIVNKGGVQNSSYINGVYRTYDIVNTIWDHSLLLNFNKDLSKDLNLTATVGGNYRADTYKQNGEESVTQIVFGFINHSNFQEHSSTNGFTGQPMQYMTEKIWAGAYATATLGYKDYLFVNAAARNDWTSTLESANASLFYPSASVSFVPTTAFGIESKNMNFLKLRLGYGTSAGFPVPYLTRNTLDINGRGFVDVNGTALGTNALSSRLGYAGLKPELQQEIEFGVEGKFLNNRLGVDLSLYDRTTTNLITNAPLDPATGYLSTSTNIGKLDNKGIELTLTGTPLILGDFRWDITMNFFKYNSKIVTLTKDLSSINIAGFTSPGNYAVAGQPFGEIYGYGVARDPASGQRLVDGTGLYLQSDNIMPLGSPIPDYTTSFINNFSYKGITLSFQLDYRKGGWVYSQTGGTVTARGTTKDTDGDRYLVY